MQHQVANLVPTPPDGPPVLSGATVGGGGTQLSSYERNSEWYGDLSAERSGRFRSI